MNAILAQHRDVLGTLLFLVGFLGLFTVVLLVMDRWLKRKHFKSMADEVAARRRINDEQVIAAGRRNARIHKAIYGQ